MQVRLHREAYIDVWNTGGSYSKGFFPPESSFAMHMVPALVQEGIEWVLVDSGHIDRTLADLPWSSASSIRPNRADQRNGVIADWNSQWTQLQNVWAPTQVAAPFSYQPRRIRYVDPWSDPNDPTIYEMIAVPAARYEGNENARGGYGAFKPENVWSEALVNSRNTDPNRPMLLVAHSDGDNHGTLNQDVYHGQHQLFLDMTLGNAHFAHTSIQDYLELYPVPPNDPYIHVEPGSWIGLDGGTPYFEKWVEDNAVDGEHPDHWSWSMLIAALNRTKHAESLESSYSMNDVRWGIGSDTAKAWYHYLNAEASDYWYWDFDRANPWDGNVTRAANLAIEEANKVINRHPGVDTIGPSIFHPQRPIWNPGGNHWGVDDGNLIQPSDFEIWTFVYDVSGVADVRLYWRTADWDSYADLDEFRHEIYAHTPGLNSPWNIETMAGAWYPTVKGPLVPEPAARAQRYSAEIAGQSDTLITYFVEAVDLVGNTNRSEIFHVWVGEHSSGNGSGNGGDPGPEGVVWSHPETPIAGQQVTIYYNPQGRGLPSTSAINIHHGYNGGNWTAVPGVPMTQAGDYWSYTYVVPADATSLVMVFNHNGQDPWDNNNGQNFTIPVEAVAPVVTTWIEPPVPTGCDPITIYYDPTDRPLDGSDPVYIHVTRFGWAAGDEPAQTMTESGGVWSYTFTPLPGTESIRVTFDDGAATSDTNDGPGWIFTLPACHPPTGFLITDPPEDVTVPYAVSDYAVHGVADGVVGVIHWTNSLTGDYGVKSATSPWSLFDVSLAVGANLITVSGEIPGTGEEQVIAADDAAQYSSGWDDGSNEGIGFGLWTLSAEGGSAGHFVNTTTGWGFWSHEGDNLAQALRDFVDPLSVGQTFHVHMQNGWIWEGGGSVGVALRNAQGDTLWELYFNGGDPFYSSSTGETDINWTDAGLDVAFTLTGESSYEVVITPSGGTARQYAGTFEGGPITQFRAWSYNNGTNDEFNSNRDFFVNDLSISGVGSGEPIPVSASVTITRRADEGDPDSNGDGIPDSWYHEFAPGTDVTDANAGNAVGMNGHTLRESYLLNLDPREEGQVFRFDALNFVGGILRADWGGGEDRAYAVEYTPSLAPPAWTNALPDAVNLPDNGGGRATHQTDLEPNGGMGFYRIRLQTSE